MLEAGCANNRTRGHRPGGPAAMRAGRPAGGGRGFTLIEVLVALAILVIGVYAMLTIFPRGFSAIEAGQQRTVAAQLAEGEIARWKLHPEALPEAIVATDYDGNLITATLYNTTGNDNLERLLVFGEGAVFFPARLEGVTLTDALVKRLFRPLVYDPQDIAPTEFDLALAPGSVTAHPNWQPNTIYLPRTIIGERIDIRQLATSELGVPFYLLSHAPLDVLRRDSGDGTGPAYVDIYDARPWRYVPGRAPADLGPREFTATVDGTGLWLDFGPGGAAPAVPRAFKVDYTNPGFERVLGVTIMVPASTTRASDPLPAGVDPETIQVYERLIALTEDQREYLATRPQEWPRNAYYVADPETQVSGKIEFSPLLQSDPRATDISLVKVDYRVLDWQILVFDVEVAPNGVVQLPVGQLKGASYTNPPRQSVPQEVARGVKQYYNQLGTPSQLPASDPRTYAYLVAVDRQTGEILVDHEGLTWPTNAWERSKRFRVNYRDGLLYFNYAAWQVEGFNPQVDTPNRFGRTYRVFCRAQADWSVQLMMAARQYARSTDTLPGGPPAIGSAGTVLTYGWVAEEPRQLRFPLSEAGQAVAVDYYYWDEEQARLVYQQGEVRNIGHPEVLLLGGKPYWVCKLEEPLQQQPNDWGPVVVRGLTLRARSAWVTPGREATIQDLAEAFDEGGAARRSLEESWQHVIVTSYFSRTPI